MKKEVFQCYARVFERYEADYKQSDAKKESREVRAHHYSF